MHFAHVSHMQVAPRIMHSTPTSQACHTCVTCISHACNTCVTVLHVFRACVFVKLPLVQCFHFGKGGKMVHAINAINKGGDVSCGHAKHGCS